MATINHIVFTKHQGSQHLLMTLLWVRTSSNPICHKLEMVGSALTEQTGEYSQREDGTTQDLY